MAFDFSDMDLLNFDLEEIFKAIKDISWMIIKKPFEILYHLPPWVKFSLKIGLIALIIYIAIVLFKKRDAWQQLEY